MAYNIDVLGEDFVVLVQLFKILKENMTFIDIQNGKIAQYDDSRRLIYDINLSDIIGDFSFNIYDMKKKIKLFETFKEDVNLEIDDDSLIIKDSYSKLTIKKTDASYCQTPYIKSIDKIYELFSKNCVLKTKIPKIISERIRASLQIFDVNNLKLKAENGKASILIDSLSKDQNMVFYKDIELKENIDFEMFFSPNAFLIESDEDIDFSVYAEREGEFLFNHNVMFDSLNINIFGRVFDNNS